ncbi:MAG: AraC family transcriptional regulator [Oscillospiraceae bacterium]
MMLSSTYKQSFKQNYTDNVELSIFNCGLQSCESGYTWGPAVRDHYLIHYVVSGHGSYTVNGTAYELSAGDLFLAKPSQLITYSADVKEPWEYYWVGFNGACANKLVLQLPFKENMPIHHCKSGENVKKALLDIFLSRGLSARNEALMVGYLYIFIAQLMQEAAEMDTHSTSSSSLYVINAIKYIQFNYSHDISIDDIAKAVGVSRSHLYRVFMCNVGQSPIDYLTSYRISEACYLLKSSHLSIAEIAVSVGFFDQFYFSRVFKKSKGMPPSKYLASQEPAV